MPKNIEQTPAELADRAYWREVMRVLEVARGGVADADLLEELLNGREKTTANVQALLALSREHFERDARIRIERACKDFLGVDYKPIAPKKFYSILDEMADEAVARGQKDEFLEGLRTK